MVQVQGRFVIFPEMRSIPDQLFEFFRGQEGHKDNVPISLAVVMLIFSIKHFCFPSFPEKGGLNEKYQTKQIFLKLLVF